MAAVGAVGAGGQVVLLRELMVVCAGNELAAGIGLTVWMLATAAGSSAGAWLLRRRETGAGAWTAVALAALVLAMPAALWLLHVLRAALGPPAGEVVAPHQVLAVAGAALGLPCLLLGLLFPLLCRRMERSGLEPPAAAARVFWIEALGFGGAGLLAGLVLISHVSPAVAWLRPGAIGDEQGTERLVTRDTPYARIEVRRTGDQHDVYLDGLWSHSYPDPEGAERTAHYPLLLHPAPRTVLLIGGATTGVPAEILAHPSVAQLDVVELDPALVEVARAFLPAEATAALEDPRVTLHLGDGRAFVRDAEPGRYDALLVVLPDPQNAQLNRYYTVEFHETAARALAPGGVLSTGVTGSADMLGPTQAELVASVHTTLAEVFPSIAALPGATIRFVCAAEEGGAARDPSAMAAQLRERGLETRHVTPFDLGFGLGPLRTDYLDQVLADATASEPNRDLAPLCFYQDTLLWATAQAPGLRGLYLTLGRLQVGWLAALLLAGALLHAGATRLRPSRARARDAAVSAAVAAVGATGIAVEVALILGYQVAYGVLYARLGLVVAAYMLGLAAGSWVVARGWIQPRRAWLIGIQVGMALGCAGLAAVAATDSVGAMPGWAEPAIPLVLLGFGAAAGAHFPCAVHTRSERAAAGALYAIDLAGAAAAALVVSVALIPVLGVPAVMALLVVLNAGSAAVLLASR